jgi:hypothetical protein
MYDGKDAVLWDVASCGITHRRFGGTCRLHSLDSPSLLTIAHGKALSSG